MGWSSALGGAVRRKGLHKGIIGGNRAWFLVGVCAYAIRFAKRLSAKDSAVINTENLRPGETLIIEAHNRPSRRQRRAAERAAHSQS